MRKALLAMILFALFLAGCGTDVPTAEMPEDFSFSLRWGVIGVHYYDSVSGLLVKSGAEPDKDAYRTTLIPDEELLKAAWAAVSSLDWEKYTEEYNPNPDEMTAPSATIILSVTENGREHSVRCPGISLSYSSADRDGQAFLDVVRELEQLLISTPEWEMMPDYTVYFD